MQVKKLDLSKFGERLRKYRKSKNLVISDFYDLFDISPSSMSGFENGKNKPSISLFYEMSMFFDDLDLRWLITGKGSMDEACVEEDAADYEVINKRAQRLNQFFNEWMATHDADEQAWLEIQIKNTLPEYADFLINRAED